MIAFKTYFGLKDYIYDIYCKYFVYWFEIIVSWKVNFGRISETI